MVHLKQPFVALIGVGGAVFCTILALLMAGADDKTPIVIAIGFGMAMLTKAATSFGQGAPKTAVALFITFAVTVLAPLSIVGVAAAVTAMTDNGLAAALGAGIGLYAGLLGSAQDRPRDDIAA